MNSVIIMQGVPGSGKSTIAELLAKTSETTVVCSADSYMMVDGKYVFRPENLPYAHDQCYQMAKQYLGFGYTVIIDNTNIKRIHAIKYVELAEQFGVPVQVIRCYGRFQNVHGVPEPRVELMREQMEEIL